MRLAKLRSKVDLVLVPVAEENADKHVLAQWLKEVVAIKAARMTIAQAEDMQAIEKLDEQVTAIQDVIQGKETEASLSESRSCLVFHDSSSMITMCSRTEETIRSRHPSSGHKEATHPRSDGDPKHPASRVGASGVSGTRRCLACGI